MTRAETEAKLRELNAGVDEGELLSEEQARQQDLDDPHYAEQRARQRVVETPQLINTGDLAWLLGVSQMTITRWRKAGYVPKPVYCEKRVTLWSTVDIREWLEAGCPWDDKPRGKREARRMSREQIDELLRPVPYDAGNPKMLQADQRSADRANELLNDAGGYEQPDRDIQLDDREARLRGRV